MIESKNNKIKNKISNIITILKNVSMGDFSHKLKIETKKNELTELKIALNMMIDDLKELKEAQKKYDQELKIKVDQKTKELHEKIKETHILTSIVENADNAIISKDLDGNILSWNQGAEKMYGYKEDEIVGKNISLLLPKDRPNEVKDILAKIAKGEQVEHFETRRVKKDGKTIDVALTISPIKDEVGKIIGASTIARDITQEKIEKEEAEKLTKLMIGRELKMIELKKEIAKLKGENTEKKESDNLIDNYSNKEVEVDKEEK